MDVESQEIMVLGSIRRGARKFDKISQMAKIEPRELDKILQSLEQKAMIRVEEKKGIFGKKIEIKTTQKGDMKLEERIGQMQKNWQEMELLYKTKDKDKLGQMLDSNKSALPMMMFFGVMDMMMFSMMFSMIGSSIGDYVPAEQIPDSYSDAGDDGGFDFDIGF